MKHDKILVFILLYWILYSGLIRIFIFNHDIFSIIPDCILLYLFIRLCRYKKRDKITQYINPIIPVFCSIFLILGTISMLINGSFIIPYFWNIRFYVRALLTFYIIWKTMNINDCKKFRKIMYYAFLPNLLFCLIENSTGRGGDSLGGLFGGGNMEMVLYLMLMTFLSTADYYNKKLSKFKFLGIIGISLFLSFLGEIKLLYITIPLFWYIGYILFRKVRFKQVAILAIGLLFFIPIMQFFLSFFYNTDYVESVFTIERTKSYTAESSFIIGQENGMNRSSSIKMTNEFILKDISHLISGYGIGASSTSTIFYSPIGTKYRDTFFFLFTPSYIMVETGEIGLILYLSVYILLLFTFIRYYKKFHDPILRYWAVLGILSTMMTFILIWYNITPVLIFLIFYYFFAFCLVAIRDRLNIIHQNNKLNYRLNNNIKSI